jgi:branched-chain amino acid transport system substrate-binding protein
VSSRRAIISSVACIAALMLAGCASGSAVGSSGGSSASGSKVIQLVNLEDLTGDIAFAGTSAEAGIKLAVSQVNSSGLLGGGRTFKLTEQDAQSSPPHSQTVMSEIAASDAQVVIGPILDQEADVDAPIAQRSGIPYVATQSGGANILGIGDDIFRMTAPQQYYQQLDENYAKVQGDKRLAILYDTDQPSQVIEEQYWAQSTKAYGYSFTSIDGVSTSTTDFSAAATKIASEKPDAVVVLLVGAQNPSFLTQLWNDGYKGQIIGALGMSGGSITSLGTRANGIVWATDFTPLMKTPLAENFVSAFKAANGGKLPDNFAAEAYDAVYFIARAIAKTSDTSRSGIDNALSALTKTGFDGVCGHLTFAGHDERQPGTLIRWENGQQVPFTA